MRLPKTANLSRITLREEKNLENLQSERGSFIGDSIQGNESLGHILFILFPPLGAQQ